MCGSFAFCFTLNFELSFINSIRHLTFSSEGQPQLQFVLSLSWKWHYGLRNVIDICITLSCVTVAWKILVSFCLKKILSGVSQSRWIESVAPIPLQTVVSCLEMGSRGPRTPRPGWWPAVTRWWPGVARWLWWGCNIGGGCCGPAPPLFWDPDTDEPRVVDPEAVRVGSTAPTTDKGLKVGGTV